MFNYNYFKFVYCKALKLILVLGNKFFSTRQRDSIAENLTGCMAQLETTTFIPGLCRQGV